MNPPAAAPSLEQLQQLKQVRRASLLKRWTSGNKLTDQEMSEISDILPPEVLANPPLPRSGLRKSHKFYAELYGCEERTTKRWVGLGKKARKPCPLDSPASMPAWWEDLKGLGFIKQSVPPRLIDAATKAIPPAVPGIPGVESLPGKPDDKKTDPPKTGQKVDFTGLRGVGLAAAVRELEIQLDANQRALRLAMESGENDAVVTKCKKHFEDTLDLLRKTEDSLQKLQAARGDLISLSKVRADLMTLLTTLRGMMRRRADNICTGMAALLTPAQLAKLKEELTKQEQREETQMRSAKFWKRNPDGSIDA